MAKKDNGHEETDKLLKEIEDRITKEYSQAEQELQEKIDDYMRRFRIKDKLKRQALAAGEITKAEYDQWRIGQLAIGQRWEEMKQTISEDLANADQIARSIAYGYMPEVYAINHNYATFQVEKGLHINTSYSLYSHESVEWLFAGGVFYPSPGRVVTEQINLGLATEWNKKQVQSVMIQSILQGESIGKIATRLAETVGESNRKAAIRNARTMTTCVESAGRVNAYRRAESMGIELDMEWMATLDGRTRHAHRQADGQRVPPGKPFIVDGYKMEYPGDPSAPGYLVYNCRCTLAPALKEYSYDSNDKDLRSGMVDGMTYAQWKAQKTSTSQSITHQDEVEETMRRIYGAEYRHYASLSGRKK